MPVRPAATLKTTLPQQTHRMKRWPVIEALNSEWDRLSRTDASAWGEFEPALASLDQLGGVLERIRQHPDPTLAALIRLGRAGDQLAWRAVLQATLGMVVRLCVTSPQLLEAALSELWLLIAEYPLERRPRAIAANLRWELRRRIACTCSPLAPSPLPSPAEPDAAATLSQARHLGLIDQATHRTLWEVYVAGNTSAEAAKRLGTTAAAVRWRCSAALRRLAQHAELLAA